MTERKYSKTLDMSQTFWKYGLSDEMLLELVDVIFERITNRKSADIFGCFSGKVSVAALRKIKEKFAEYEDIDQLTDMTLWTEIYKIYSKGKLERE